MIADYLIGWLRERADEAGALGAVVGISGGVGIRPRSRLCA